MYCVQVTLPYLLRRDGTYRFDVKHSENYETLPEAIKRNVQHAAQTLPFDRPGRYCIRVPDVNIRLTVNITPDAICLAYQPRSSV